VSSRYFDFVVRNETGVIPATFWNALPSLGAPPPITLVQHGGPLHKRHEQSDRLAESLVQRTGGAVLLIDGPIHGQRRTEHLEPQQMLSTFQRYWREDAGIDGMVSDWSTALDAVLDQGWADPDRVAWLGVSMGTAYGIPVCAADDRIKAAALGMWGVDWGQGARLLDAARRMKTPALFQIKDQDQFFSTEGQRELFDALGSADKCLCSFPGEHSLAAPGQLDQLLNFVGQAFAEQAA
jgi:hypothetical protein